MRFEPVKAISDLKEGDLIRHVISGESDGALVVPANYGSYVIAVKTQHVSNAIEREVMRREAT